MGRTLRKSLSRAAGLRHPHDRKQRACGRSCAGNLCAGADEYRNGGRSVSGATAGMAVSNFKNLFFDRYRRAVLENEYVQNGQPGYTEDQGMQEIENAILLDSLAPQDRAIFQLRYFDGYSAQEISRMLELPPGTVRSKLSRCRKHLKQNLDL